MAIQNEYIDPHKQNTDTKLDEGGTNEINASELVKALYNIVLLAFYRAIDSSKTIYNLLNGFIDEYEDESGIDTVSSTGEKYDSANDLYSPDGTLDSNTKLVLHCNGADESTTFTDSSPSEHTVTAHGTAQLDTAEKKFGTASGLFDGNSDYLSIPDSNDWDIWGSNSDNWTIDFWVKHNSLPTGGGAMPYMSQRQSSSERWEFWMFEGYGLWFALRTSDTYVATLQGAEITDTNWHHVAMCKVGSSYGMYLDGTQTGYLSYSGTKTFAGSLQIAWASMGGIFDGHLDEIRIVHSNAFNASPDSGKTDTITVPTSEYGLLQNMSLISNSVSAESQPDSARIFIFEEDDDTITLNTDLKAYVSRDDGDTWAEATLLDESDYDISKRVLTGTVDLSASGIGSGTDMIYKLDTANNKDLKIHGTGLLWD
ncbi:MAG: LamG domain-containing protein [Candidatus Izemoplasmatales bacterium]